MFKRKGKINKKQASTLNTITIPPIEPISFNVAPDDIPLLYYSMKSIVIKLEPYMEQSLGYSGVTKPFSANISSVVVDTSSLDTNMLNKSDALDLNIVLTGNNNKRKESMDEVDLNQHIPFQNAGSTSERTNEGIICDNELGQVGRAEEDSASVDVCYKNSDKNRDKSMKTNKECDVIIMDTNTATNTALSELLHEYEYESNAYREYDLDCNYTLSTSTVDCDDNDDDTIANDAKTKNHDTHAAATNNPIQERDDYLATILEEYSPFYNFPYDEETSEIERTCYNPYKMVFSGQF
ncbi:hypothetical protein CANMA_002691 [Candida margitis]|uniref:uncharacterized protein n=1 Tax=Candida margitis TaxID=1775924 RepID=UPI002226B7B7|nr:uncharacterized protein CANMA_002691 [Candida margitis]KAI5967923.1 hypothetical protein CANMA_002691 [Candida margitis]